MNSLLEHVSLLTRILGSPVAAVTLAASVPRDDAGDFDQKALGEELKHQGFENHLQKRPLGRFFNAVSLLQPMCMNREPTRAAMHPKRPSAHK